MSTVPSEISKYIGSATKLADIWGTIIYNVKAAPYNAKGDNVQDDGPKILAACNVATISGGEVILPPGTYKVSTSFTVPPNVKLWFVQGAILSIDTGATVTINGPIEAGLQQIFSGLGLVAGKIKVPNVVPEWWGAKGDGIVDDTVPLKSVVAYCKSSGEALYLPNKYLVSSTIVIDFAISIAGEGPNNSQLITKSNIAIIQYDVSVNDIYFGEIKDVGFVDQNTGIRTSVAGILVTGIASTYFNYNDFQDLGFFGTYYGIRFSKSGNIGGENQHDWNNFDDLFFVNSATNNPQYGIKFDNGSGTGNTFNDMRIGALTAGLMWGGGQDVNIGYIVISNTQFNTSTAAIKMTKGATSYGERIAITDCQWDAGNVYGIDFNGMGVFSVRGCNWGGSTSANLVNCYAYTIDGFESCESRIGMLTKSGIAIGATVNLFSLVFPASVFQSLFLEIVTFGLQQGIGSRIITTRYHVAWDGTGATWTQLDNFATGTAGNQLSHSPTGGTTPKIACVTVGTTAGSELKSNVRIIGDKYAINRL